jgi:hexosaminidase
MRHTLRISKTSFFAILVAMAMGSAGAAVNIVPLPSTITPGAGTFTVPASLTVFCDAASADSCYPWIYKLFTQAGATVKPGAQSAAQVIVTKSSALSSTLGKEGYNLTITATGITIAAAAQAGQFYAVQTIRQLLPATIERAKLTTLPALPVVTISDKPRYAVRACMLDVARHFQTINVLKNEIDRMSLFKINNYHLHLSDDQGWRLEIKGYPKLTSVGGTTQVNATAPAGTVWAYTQAQMIDFVNYARQRNVDIIPEFDMPGHVQAALASYPTLAPVGANTALYTGINTGFSSFNCRAAAVATFLETLWTECATIFPGQIYHTGGDEAQSTTAADYNYFIQLSEQKLNARGKKMMGWEEIAKAMQLSTSLPQAWNIGHSGKIQSSCDHLFVDMANDGNDQNAMSWCVSSVPLDAVYKTPTGSAWTGIEACLWGEYITSQAALDKRNWPRLAALAEVGWSPSPADLNNGWTAFASRIGTFGCRFNQLGVGYYNTPLVSWQTCGANSTAASVFAGFDPSTIRYTSVIGDVKQQALSSRTWTKNDKIVDIRGRVVGTIGNYNLKASRTLANGVYFYVKDNNSIIRNSSVKVSIGE